MKFKPFFSFVLIAFITMFIATGSHSSVIKSPATFTNETRVGATTCSTFDTAIDALREVESWFFELYQAYSAGSDRDACQEMADFYKEICTTRQEAESLKNTLCEDGDSATSSDCLFTRC